MERVRVMITGKNFAYGLKTVKRIGGIYDPSSKTWAIPADAAELNALHLYSLKAVAAPAVDPATTYVGQASMDAENSIF